MRDFLVRDGAVGAVLVLFVAYAAFLASEVASYVLGTLAIIIVGVAQGGNFMGLGFQHVLFGAVLWAGAAVLGHAVARAIGRLWQS